MEQWKDLKGFDISYKISNRRRIISKERKTITKYGVEVTLRERILSPSIVGKKKKECVYLLKGGIRVQVFIDDLINEYFGR